MKIHISIVLVTLGVLLVAGAGCNKSQPEVEQYIPSTKKVSIPSTPLNEGGQVPDAVITPSVGELTKKAAIPTSAVAAAISYTEALNIYQRGGAYFQFVKCRGNPGRLSMKKGTKFMLDNWDRIEHTIAINKVISYLVGGYSFAIATAPAAGQYYITCDGGGAALVNVED